jgi:hypothetical protein
MTVSMASWRLVNSVGRSVCPRGSSQSELPLRRCCQTRIVRAIMIGGRCPPNVTWQRSNMGMDRHLEAVMPARSNTKTDRHLPKVEAAGSSPVSRRPVHQTSIRRPRLAWRRSNPRCVCGSNPGSAVFTGEDLLIRTFGTKPSLRPPITPHSGSSA